jgi:hypothetical protein
LAKVISQHVPQSSGSDMIETYYVVQLSRHTCRSPKEMSDEHNNMTVITLNECAVGAGWAKFSFASLKMFV